MFRLLTALMLFLPGVVAHPVRAETARICIDADTWFSEANNGKNGAKSKTLVTKGTTGDRIRTLIGFDVSSIPAGAIVTSATVSLWVIDPDASAVSVRRMTAAWTEEDATWQNTANGFSATAETSFTPNVEKVFITFDIASLVRKWLDGTNPNYGIMLVASSAGNEATYASSDAVTESQRPCMTVTYSGSSIGSSRFKIRHDGGGTFCVDESFSVAVETLNNAAPSSYTRTITLTTQSGVGTFSSASGNHGTLIESTRNDGQATYTFDALDAGVATFLLDYPDAGGGGSGASVDLDAYQTDNPNMRDDDSEGLLVFSPAGFGLTAHAVPDPAPSPIGDPIGNRTAGAPFAVHLAAAGGASSCGVSNSYSGDKSLRFWVVYLDPIAAPVVPTIDGRPIATSEATAQPQVVRFTQGRASVTARYKDTGRIAIRVVDPGAATPIQGSTGEFVSLPADLRIVAVENAQGRSNPGAAVPDGELFARAGEPFRVIVDAVDAEGDRTPSFGRESMPEGIRLRSFTLVAPVGGRNGTHGDGTIEHATSFTADPTPGRFVGDSFAFDEVGAIRLQAAVADGSFLGTGPVVGNESGTVGRFAPSHFEVVANAPRFATACPVGAFTWLGQPFGWAVGSEAVLVVTAVNRGGETTANYAASWFRLTNATLAHRRYVAGGATVDESGLPATSVDPRILSNEDGTARLMFSTGSGLVLARDTPRAPFDAELALSIDVLDADGTAWPSNPFLLGGTSAGAGIAFDTAKRFQSGRLRLDNAYGSELVPLAMRLRTQRFDGTAFDDDDSDSCSAVPESAVLLTPSPATLTALPAVAHVPLFGGDAGLSLAAPGTPGDVALRIDLGATGANLPWLRADWPDDGNLDGLLDDDPQARATFGIWEGRDAMIFVRELY